MEKIKYPENTYLREEIAKSGKSVTYIAKKLNVSREILSRTIHGKHKGDNLIPLIKIELGIETSNVSN